MGDDREPVHSYQVCPKCGSADTYHRSGVKTTRKGLPVRVRYRGCRDCGHHYAHTSPRKLKIFTPE